MTRVRPCAPLDAGGLARGLDASTILAALRHQSSDVRQQAVSLAALDWHDRPELRTACLRLATDEGMGVRFRLARGAGRIEGEEKLPALLALAGTVDVDGWLARVLAASAADVAPAFCTLGTQNSSGSAHQCRRKSKH